MLFKQPTKYLFIILVAALAVTGSFALINERKESHDDSSNISDGKTYEDKDFGFRFKYPTVYSFSRRPPSDDKPNGFIMVYQKSERRGFEEPYVQITLPPLKDSSAFPNARTLNDYLTPQYFSGIYTIIIDCSERSIINGWQALRQKYRAGELVNGDLRLEGPGSTLEGVRYVFYNGANSFVIITANRNSSILLDNIASTFEFLAQNP